MSSSTLTPKGIVPCLLTRSGFRGHYFGTIGLATSLWLRIPFTKELEAARATILIFSFSLKMHREIVLTAFFPQKGQINSGKTPPIFSSGAECEVTDVGFYQLYEVSSRVIPPSQFTKDQPMRMLLFQPETTKGRRREGIGRRLRLLPNRSRPRPRLRRAA